MIDDGTVEQGLGMGFKDLLAITRLGCYFNLANLSGLIDGPLMAGVSEYWSLPESDM